MLKSTEHEFIMLINVKMPIIVGILTFIGMINTPHESIKQEQSLLLSFVVIEQLKFHAQLSLSLKKVL